MQVDRGGSVNTNFGGLVVSIAACLGAITLALALNAQLFSSLTLREVFAGSLLRIFYTTVGFLVATPVLTSLSRKSSASELITLTAWCAFWSGTLAAAWIVLTVLYNDYLMPGPASASWFTYPNYISALFVLVCFSLLAVCLHLVGWLARVKRTQA